MQETKHALNSKIIDTPRLNDRIGDPWSWSLLTLSSVSARWYAAGRRTAMTEMVSSELLSCVVPGWEGEG